MQTPWGELDVRDAHVHFFSDRFFEQLAGQAGKTREQLKSSLEWDLPPEDPADLARRWVAELDRYGVRQAALIASVPGDEASVLAAKAAFPDRFYAFAMVNPLTPGTQVTRGLNAICLFPAMHRYSIHDDAALLVLDQASEAGCAVFVHCGVLSVGVRRKLGLASPYDMRFSNPLALHAIALKYPKLRFIVPHFGAGYFREALMLCDLCPNVWLDTSSSNSWMRYEGLDLKTVFQRALEVAGAGRLLFGTDSSFFPRGWQRHVFEAQVGALRELCTADECACRILGGNLKAVLR